MKRVSTKMNNVCEIVNGEPDEKSCIYVNESLTKQNGELLRKVKERGKEKQYLYRGYQWKLKYKLNNMKKVIILGSKYWKILTKFKLNIKKAVYDDTLYHQQELLTFIVDFCWCFSKQLFSYFSICLDHFSS